MKTGYIVPVILAIVMVSGCGKNRKKAKYPKNSEVATVDIPMAQDNIKSFFDEDISGFSLAEDTQAVQQPVVVSTNENPAQDQARQYTWVEETTDEFGFKKIYFDFDKYAIRDDQQTNLDQDIQLAKKMIEECKFFGKEAPMIVIDGHACNSAGSRVYNLALSERRAKVLADKFIEAGVDPELVKIVGRGSEVPALVDGKPCQGSRDDQWANRRDELRIVYS